MSDLNSQNDSRHSDLARQDDDRSVGNTRSEQTGLMMRLNEQWAVAGALLVSAAIIGGYVLFLSNRNDRLIDIDDQKYQPAHYAVDINNAPWPELANIPSVGRNVAETIVQHRDEFGPFAAIDDLVQVPGVGQGTLEAMRPYLLPITSPPSQLSSK